MTSFDVDFDSGELQAEFSRLKELGSSDRVYRVGSNVEYGIYLEMGTRHMPPYPWFAPAIREFQADPEGFILKHTEYSRIEDIPTTDKVVEAVAFGLENAMANNVSAGKSVSRSPGTNPEHPRRQDGNLVSSIQAVRIK